MAAVLGRYVSTEGQIIRRQFKQAILEIVCSNLPGEDPRRQLCASGELEREWGDMWLPKRKRVNETGSTKLGERNWDNKTGSTKPGQRNWVSILLTVHHLNRIVTVSMSQCSSCTHIGMGLLNLTFESSSRSSSYDQADQ